MLPSIVPTSSQHVVKGPFTMNNTMSTNGDVFTPSTTYEFTPVPEVDEVILTSQSLDVCIQKLNSIPHITTNQNASVKNRLGALENANASQHVHNTFTNQTVSCIGTKFNHMEEQINNLVQQLQDNFDAKINSMKKEYDHRFDLQASENKRLQNHISSLKADSVALKKKLHQTAEKLHKLQIEMGVETEEFIPEEIDENISLFSASRPTTSKLP